MARQVRLVVGEGDDKVQLGVAEIERAANGDTMVVLTITNPTVVAALGGNQIRGTIPNAVQPEPPEEPNE